MFSTGLLVSAGATIGIAILDKQLEDTGFFWLSTALKLVIPLIGLGFGVYFLEHNPITTRWLR